jgi:hypothetical protein
MPPNTCNPSTQEAEVGSRAQNQPGLNSETHNTHTHTHTHTHTRIHTHCIYKHLKVIFTHKLKLSMC